MYTLKALSTQKPVLFTLLLVFTCIALLYCSQLLGIENIFYKDIVSSVIKNIISISLLIMIIKFNWLERSLLTTPFKRWNSKWLLASLPIVIVAILNLVSIDFSILSFNYVHVIGWVYTNFSTGFFEEIMLRGVCFTVLYAAWKDKENALMKAAIFQAFIFGIAHYVNLTKAPFLEVSVQVTYATLIGFAFAGLVGYSRSLWPAIVLHTIINACGSINLFFDPNYAADAMSMASYAVVIVLIFVTCALPGYFLLRKATALLQTKNLVTP